MLSRVNGLGLSIALRGALLGCVFGLASFAVPQVSVTTYHNDNARTGLNNQETFLRPSNVNQATFGLIFSLPVDGYVYAQPLYLPKLTIPGKGVHNVLFVATEHNSVYAFDADSNTGTNSTPLWHENFGPSVPNGDVGSDDINPEIGITGTPVIAPGVKGGTPTLYFVTKTKTLSNVGGAVYTQKLHALDCTTGAEKFGGPVQIKAQVDGVGVGNDGNGHVPFNSLIQSNRPALLLLGSGSSQIVYVPFASHGDQGPYHGWILGYNATTLKLVQVLNTTPNALNDPSGYPLAAGGIWQGGAGMASDGLNIFCATGNGTFDPSTGAYGDSVLRILPSSSNLLIQDYFSPSDQQTLDDYDSDLGSGGVLVLPTNVGSSAHPDLMVQAGKEGTIYLIDRHNLGHNGTSDNVVQELVGTMNGIWGMPAYFNGNFYFGPNSSPIVQYRIQNGQIIGSNWFSQSPDSYGYPGTTPGVSSDLESNGIVWAIENDQYNLRGPASLHAYLASNVATELYNSANTSGRDTMAPPAKFSTPTIVNGKVYAGTSSSVAVFGLGKWAATPVVTPASGNYTNQYTVTITEATPGAKVYYTTDGSTPTTSSTLYRGPVTLTQSANFSAKAFAEGIGESYQTLNYYQVNAKIGSGTGLWGSYFNGTEDPTTGTPTITEVNPTINFNWNGGSPATGVGDTNWSCEWTGYIEAETTGTYTFTTESDDGVRLTVNGDEIINDWTDHAPTYDTGTINLVAGTKYPVVLDYYQDGGGSLLYLYWQTLGMPYQIVPESQLLVNLKGPQKP